MANPIAGLSDAEAADRLRRGLGNRPPRQDLLDYVRIFARNLFTGFNAMVAPAAAILFTLGDYRAAVAVSGMAVVNSSLSIVQEIRAKILLARLSLIAESVVRVRRDNRLVELRSGDVVQGDCVEIRSGDVVVADGPLLESHALQIDESLLTGESDAVSRQVGEQVLSGSVCIAGEGAYRAERVGAESYAQKTSENARRYSPGASPLTRSINRIVQILSYTAILLCVVHAAAWRWFDLPEDDAVRRVAATITTMVPQGLVLSATISFLVGAMALSRRGALVQRLEAIETMAAVDVICTDKTGTLTTNRLRVELLQPLGVSDELFRLALRHYASASIDRDNRNIAALRGALGEIATDAIDQIGFQSRLRLSAARLTIDGRRKLLVLGAVEALRDRCGDLGGDFDNLAQASQRHGLRLLLFAEGDADVSLADVRELPEMALVPLGLIGLRDELRGDAETVLRLLDEQSIAIKIVSGDNAETVQGTVRSLDLPHLHGDVVSGIALNDVERRSALIERCSIFGRIAPDQKVIIVETLKAHGHRVAMIGDGVNDVLAIKSANLGIAMGSGSSASKAVSGLVLAGDRFEVLPETLDEGRAIVRNVRRGAKLFLVKNVYAFLLILACYAGLGLPFPLAPQQVTLLNWTVIGVPALAMAMSRQRALTAEKRPFLFETLGFAVRTGLVIGLAGIVLLLHGERVAPGELSVARTMLLSFLILMGLHTLFRALGDNEPNATAVDWAYRLIGLLALPVYAIALYVPPAQRFFELTPPTGSQWVIVAGYSALAAGTLWLVDRAWSRFAASRNSPA
jgi:cation-transporting ATPase E